MSLHLPLPETPGLTFSRWIMRIAWSLVFVFVFVSLGMLFAPWQQHVSGTGRVIAFTPLDRPQDIESPVQGRVVSVFVTEAQIVRKGDPLVQLVDIDPQKIARLEAKVEAAQQDLDFTKLKVTTLESQMNILAQARDLAVDAFRAKVTVAEEKLRSAREKLRAASAELELAQVLEKRIARLSPEFIEEIRHLEAKTRVEKADSSVAGARADVEAARAALLRSKAELGKERENANARVEAIRAQMQGESAKAADLGAKVVDLEGELRAQESQLVQAPRDGRVFRLRVNTGSSIVKQGQVLLQIVPLTARPAVELFVRGVDAPLIEEGRKVRLQFEGWPAVQFVGWPSVAVGTFGGVVKLVDPTDSGEGRFRLLIVPDEEEPTWPGERWLRQGVRAKGWVLLDEVRLGYELWRQLNGFPPVVGLSEPEVRQPEKVQ